MKREKLRNHKYGYDIRDRSTEEFIPAITLIRKGWDGDRFFMGFQSAFTEIAEKRLGSEAKDVFLFILGNVGFENLVTIPQVEIARRLKIKKQNVSRAITKLIKEEILFVDALHTKYKRRFRLNDKYVWKGRLKNLKDLKRDLKKEPS